MGSTCVLDIGAGRLAPLQLENASVCQQARHSRRHASPQKLGEPRFSCVGPYYLISQRSLRQLRAARLVYGKGLVQFRQAVAHELPLKPLDSPRRKSHTFSDWYHLCVLYFVMAAVERRKSVRFSFPLTTQSFCNSNALLPAEKNRLNTGSQKAHEPAAAFSRSRCSAEEDWNTATRVEGT